MSQLVQIAINSHKNWYDANKRAVEARMATRPKELLELVDALSRMFGRIGMHRVCGACFQGVQLPPVFESYRFEGKVKTHEVKHYPGGCCGACPLLGHSKCIAKPLTCARWFCTYTQALYKETHEFLNALFISSRGAWVEGVLAEAGGDGFYLPYKPEQLRQMRIARHAVDAWEAQ